MITAVANHLWQSTVFAVAAGLLTLVFRRNPAQARCAIWLAASVKFLIPFSLLVSAGAHLQWSLSSAAPPRLSIAVQEISQPFETPTELRVSPAPLAASHPLRPVVLLAVWLCGFAGLLLLWGIRWHRLRLALRGASSIDIGAPVTTMSSSALVEPGVFGVFRPVLLLPAGVVERLAPEQLAAIVAHEMCHVRRRDNLAAAVHMVVEAVFWFHPLVWWIGARMVEERERACDEEVLRMGGEPQVYAEGILNICKFYVESPLACVSGVTGSNLKKRIEEIMTHQIARRLNFGRKCPLAAAGLAAVAGPVVIGVTNAPRLRAQQQKTKAAFEVASVKASKSTDFRDVVMVALPGGTLTVRNIPLRAIITQAYDLPFQNPQRLSGAPEWVNSERYDIEAKAAQGAIPAGLSEKSRIDRMMPMLQTLLTDRFKLSAHWDPRQLPVYSLVVSKSGLDVQKPKIEEKDCPEVPAGAVSCHNLSGGQGRGVHGKTVNMSELATWLENWTDRPLVDNTGFKGLFDIDTEGWVPMRPRPGPPPGTEPSAEDRAFADPPGPRSSRSWTKSASNSNRRKTRSRSS